MGDNINGQVGYGEFSGPVTATSKLSEKWIETPRLVEGILVEDIQQDVISLGAGEKHFCAILQDNTVKCWGYGALGQLGYGGLRSLPAATEFVQDSL